MKADAINDDPGASRKSDFAPVPLRRGSELANQHNDPKERVQLAEAEIDRLAARIAVLEHESAERDSLRQQAEQALALTRQQFSKLLDESAPLSGTNASASELEALRSELAGTAKELDQVRHELAVTKSTLQQRREENAQAWLELSAGRETTAALKNRLRIAAETNAELENQLSEANAWTFKLAGDRQKAEVDLLRAQRELSKECETRDLAEQEIRALKSTVARLKKDLLASEMDRKAVEERRDEAYSEIVTITRLLQASESTAVQRQVQLDWLMRVIQVMHFTSTWWARLLPAFWQRRLCFHRLATERLFDPEAYLRHYPDVRASGQDPLRHYIVHGMGEGRQI